MAQLEVETDRVYEWNFFRLRRVGRHAKRKELSARPKTLGFLLLPVAYSHLITLSAPRILQR